jgi:signal transduction histidine kinase/CheY-like chemotaxis protein
MHDDPPMMLTSQPCEITGLELFSSELWQNRRISSGWRASFSKLGSRILLIRMTMAPETDRSDWLRFFADREDFLNQFQSPYGGWVELWIGAEHPFAGPHVDARPLLYQFFKTEIGRINTWMGCRASQHFQTTCRLKTMPHLPYGVLWEEDPEKSLKLALACAHQKDAEELLLNNESFRDGSGQLGVWCNKESGVLKLTCFGQISQTHHEALREWFLSHVAKAQTVEVEVSHLGFKSLTLEKNWAQFWTTQQNRLTLINLEANNNSHRSDQDTQLHSHVISLLESDIEALTQKIEGLDRRVSRERRKSEEALQAKSEFLQVIDHELRIPLNGIIGMMDLLSGTELDAEQKEYVSMAELSSSKLLSQITNLLDCAKMDSGQLALKEHEFHLKDFVKTCFQRIAPQATKKGLAFRYDCQEVSYRLKSDKARLCQMVQELLLNSTQNIESGEVLLRVQVEHESEREVEIKFEVVDSDCGFSKEKKEQIVNELTLSDALATRRLSTAGLGLSLCKKLVGYMGGQMGVSGEEEEWSSFWFKVKLKKSTSRQENVFSEEEVLQELRGAYVLVAEDNAISRKVLVRELLSLGFEVEVTGNGLAALELAKSLPFDLLLLDLCMPEMQGDMVASKIKEAASFTQGPMPLMLGLARLLQSDLHARCCEQGMQGVLMKPLEVEHLKALLVKAYQDGWRIKKTLG